MIDKYKRPLGIMLGLAIAAVAVLLLYNYMTQQNLDTKSLVFPEKVQGLKLGEVISGPQAIAMISKLHGSDIAIRQGYIANYGSSSQQIMIWVSESGSKKEAGQLFDVMDKKISDAASSPGAPFTGRQEFIRSGKTVIAVKGMGMDNYYYLSGNKVYWIAIGGIDPVRTLNEIINKLP